MNISSRRKNMRFVSMVFFCMFCFCAFAQVGSVPTVSYVSNASNLTKGTVNVERLPVGTDARSVAAGNDNRFDSVPLGKPEKVQPVEGRALMWIE